MSKTSFLQSSLLPESRENLIPYYLFFSKKDDLSFQEISLFLELSFPGNLLCPLRLELAIRAGLSGWVGPIPGQGYSRAGSGRA